MVQIPDNNFQSISRLVTLASKNFQLAIWFTLQRNNSDDARCIKKLTKPKIYLVSSSSALSRQINSWTSTLGATRRIFATGSLLCSLGGKLQLYQQQSDFCFAQNLFHSDSTKTHDRLGNPLSNNADLQVISLLVSWWLQSRLQSYHQDSVFCPSQNLYHSDNE